MTISLFQEAVNFPRFCFAPNHKECRTECNNSAYSSFLVHLQNVFKRMTT